MGVPVEVYLVVFQQSTAKHIRKIMDKLNLREVERHFEVELDANDDDTENESLSEIEPFLVHNKVTVDAFYKYINDSEDFDDGSKSLRIRHALNLITTTTKCCLILY